MVLTMLTLSLKTAELSMSEVESFSIYNASDIEMVGQHNAPPDSVINQFASLLEENDGIKMITSMAFHLVLGSNDMPEFNKSEAHLRNIATLVPILAVLQEHGRRDIEKIVNIPVEWYMRWNKSFDEAVEMGIIEKPKDHVSSKDFGSMMGD